MIRIAKCVAGNHYYKNGANYEKQMPVYISRLTRKFYLNRNKDRDLLLKVDRGMEAMQKDLREIKEYLLQHNRKK